MTEPLEALTLQLERAELMLQQRREVYGPEDFMTLEQAEHVRGLVAAVIVARHPELRLVPVVAGVSSFWVCSRCQRAARLNGVKIYLEKECVQV